MVRVARVRWLLSELNLKLVLIGVPTVALAVICYVLAAAAVASHSASCILYNIKLRFLQCNLNCVTTVTPLVPRPGDRYALLVAGVYGARI